jgi:hypothetical protein
MLTDHDVDEHSSAIIDVCPCLGLLSAPGAESAEVG